MFPTPLKCKEETVHEIILKPELSRFCACFCIEEITPLFSFLGTPRQEPLLPGHQLSMNPCHSECTKHRSPLPAAE